MVKDTNVSVTAEKEKTSSKKIAGIDIDKLLSAAKANYDKKEAGLAAQISTGRTIAKEDDDEDHIVWTDPGNFWTAMTGLKGLRFGRIYQCAGKSDSGKSSIASCFMKMAQEQDTLVILWDAERKFSGFRFDNKIGGKSDDLIVINTNNIIEGIKGVANVIHAAKEQNPKIKILLVWDSVGSSVSSTEDNEENEDYSKQPGVTAKEVTFAIRKINKLISRYQDKETGKNTIAALIINQTYSSIGGGMSVQIERGGVELTYLSSIILQLSRKKDLVRTSKGDKYKWGIISRCKVRKNHLHEGDENISEMDILVSADGVRLAKDVKNFSDLQTDDGDDDWTSDEE